MIRKDGTTECPSVLLLRHAATDLNDAGVWQGRATDHSLNARGRAQAREAAPALIGAYGRAPWIIVTSPLLRAVETANLLVEGGISEITRIVDESFIEMDVGSMQGKQWKDLSFDSKEAHEHWLNGRVPGFEFGESRESVLTRTSNGLKALLLENRVLVITHLFVLRAAAEIAEIEVAPSHIDHLAGIAAWRDYQTSNPSGMTPLTWRATDSWQKRTRMQHD